MNTEQNTKLTADQQLIVSAVAKTLAKDLMEIQAANQKVIDSMSEIFDNRLGTLEGAHKKITHGIFGQEEATKLQDALTAAKTVRDARGALLKASESLVGKLNLEGKQRPVLLIERRVVIASVVALTAAAGGASFLLTRHKLRGAGALPAQAAGTEA